MHTDSLNRAISPTDLFCGAGGMVRSHRMGCRSLALSTGCQRKVYEIAKEDLTVASCNQHLLDQRFGYFGSSFPDSSFPISCLTRLPPSGVLGREKE